MKARRTRKAQTNKTNYMSDEAFGDLKEALVLVQFVNEPVPKL